MLLSLDLWDVHTAMFKSKICNITRFISVWSQSSESGSCLPRKKSNLQAKDLLQEHAHRHLPYMAAVRAVSYKLPAITTSQRWCVTNIESLLVKLELQAIYSKCLQKWFPNVQFSWESQCTLKPPCFWVLIPLVLCPACTYLLVRAGLPRVQRGPGKIFTRKCARISQLINYSTN